MSLATPAIDPIPTAADRGAGRRSADRSALRVLLEWGERLVVLSLYSWLVARVWTGIWEDGKYVNLLLLSSEGLVIVFMLIRRRAADVSLRPGDWLLALAATGLPLLVVPGGSSHPPTAVAAAGVLVIGMLVQIHAKLTLGRSFGLVPANRGVKVAGPYRFVRHPMYAGYMLTHVAFLAANPSWWNLGVYVLCDGLQVLRLLAEERLLSRDEGYQAYRAAVRYRLVPLVY